jgi:hypothetical protein
MTDSLTLEQQFELIDQIQDACIKCGIFPFGGSERDRINNLLPKDLDFYITTGVDEDGMRTSRFQPLLKQVIKVLSQFEVTHLEGIVRDYPVDFDETITYQFRSKKHPEFRINGDFVGNWNKNKVDVDVNGFTRASVSLDKVGLPIPCKSDADYTLSIFRDTEHIVLKRAEIVENCKQLQFRVIMNPRSPYSDFRANQCVSYSAINAWVKGDHRIVKMLNKGWTPVYDTHKDQRCLKSASPDVILEALKDMGHLTLSDQGEPLMRYSKEGKCSHCDKMFSNEYVYELDCCHKRLHTTCVLKFVNLQRLGPKMYLNCPFCKGDPFGRKTSGVEPDSDFMKMHIYFTKVNFTRYTVSHNDEPLKSRSLTCYGHDEPCDTDCETRMIGRLNQRPYSDSDVIRTPGVTYQHHKSDFVDLIPQSSSYDTLMLNIGKSEYSIFVVEHGVGVIAEYLFDGECHGLYAGMYYRANNIWKSYYEYSQEKKDHINKILDSKLKFELNRKAITYVVETTNHCDIRRSHIRLLYPTDDTICETTD